MPNDRDNNLDANFSLQIKNKNTFSSNNKRRNFFSNTSGGDSNANDDNKEIPKIKIVKNDKNEEISNNNSDKNYSSTIQQTRAKIIYTSRFRRNQYNINAINKNNNVNKTY